MIRRMLGRTGMSVSVLALGTVKIGRDRGVKYPVPFTIPDDDAVIELLNTAADLGINLIDTAPAYGNSEERIGRLLPQVRGDFLISTKVGETFPAGVSHHDFSADQTRSSVEKSLRHLCRDRLDLVFIHSDGRDREILEREPILPTLRQLKSEGLIQAIGLSAKSADGVLAALEYGLDMVMATINTSYTEEVPAVAEAGNAGVGVLVKKAMQSGHSSAASLPWAARQRGVTAIVCGTISVEHLRQNAAAIGALTD